MQETDALGASRIERRRRGRVLIGLAASLAFAFLTGIAGTIASTRGWALAGAVSMILILPVCRFALAATRALLSFARPFPGMAATPPDDCEVALVVPIILAGPNEIRAIVEHFSRNAAFFAADRAFLLVDLPDAVQRVDMRDRRLIALLHDEFEQQGLDSRRTLLVRNRRYNAADNIWMGWERKRGKLEEFCRLTRGDERTSFASHPAGLEALTHIITIDGDSELDSAAVAELVGGRSACQAITAPTIVVEWTGAGTPFQWLAEPKIFRNRSIITEPTNNQRFLGFDLYQGKGLIDISRFLHSTEGMIDDNTVLSHDHLESCIAGGRLAHRAMLREGMPACRPAWSARHLRWMRGDFQLAPWIGGRRLDPLYRLLLAENYLKHLTPLCVFVALPLLILAYGAAALPLLIVLAAALAQPGLPLLPISHLQHQVYGTFDGRSRIISAVTAVYTTAVSALAAMLYLWRDSWIAVYAGALVFWRMRISGRRMLEWGGNAAADRARIWWIDNVGGALLIGVGGLVVLGAYTAAGLVLFWVVVPLMIDGFCSASIRASDRRNRLTAAAATHAG